MVASGKTVKKGRRLWYDTSRILRPEGTLRFSASLQDAINSPSFTRRITSGYHLSAALRLISDSNQFLRISQFDSELNYSVAVAEWRESLPELLAQLGQPPLVH